MRKKLLSAMLSLALAMILIPTAHADMLHIKSVVDGVSVDPEKKFSYEVLRVWYCSHCSTPFPDYSDYAWHTDLRNRESRCGGSGVYWWDGQTRSVKNGESFTIGTREQTCYAIAVLEPEVDEKGNHYEISYQINDGPIQSLSTSRNDNVHPRVVVDNLPYGITKTALTFYYTIPGITDKPDEATLSADALYALGLFKGVGSNAQGKPIYSLDSTPTRNEAVTMLVRLLGAYDEAQSKIWNTPFTDLQEWAELSVGYAYNNGLAAGTSGTTFGGAGNVTASQYITFVLRALGYESGVDFQWDKAWELSDKLGITKGQYNAGTTSFTRGDVVIISYNALSCKLKGRDVTLLDDLTAKGAVKAN